MNYKQRPLKVTEETTVRSWFPSRFICFDDLRGKDHTLVIDYFTEEEFPGRGGIEWIKVMYFKGAKKGIRLTPTIYNAVQDLYGKYMLGWIGKAITLYGTSEKYSKKTWEVVRVRDVRPAGKTPEKVEESLNTVGEKDEDFPEIPESPEALGAPPPPPEAQTDLNTKFRYNEANLVKEVADALKITRSVVLNTLNDLHQNKKIEDDLTINEAVALLKGTPK